MSLRSPDAPAVPRTFVSFGVAALLVGTVVMTGCDARHRATGFCAAIQRGHSEFNSSGTAPAVLAEFDRVAASAPDAVAPDLKTIAAVIRKPSRLVKNPPLIKRYFAAIGRVDRYLDQSCGLSVPPQGKLF